MNRPSDRAVVTPQLGANILLKRSIMAVLLLPLFRSIGLWSNCGQAAFLIRTKFQGLSSAFNWSDTSICEGRTRAVAFICLREHTSRDFFFAHQACTGLPRTESVRCGGLIHHRHASGLQIPFVYYLVFASPNVSHDLSPQPAVVSKMRASMPVTDAMHFLFGAIIMAVRLSLASIQCAARMN